MFGRGDFVSFGDQKVGKIINIFCHKLLKVRRPFIIVREYTPFMRSYDGGKPTPEFDEYIFLDKYKPGEEVMLGLFDLKSEFLYMPQFKGSDGREVTLRNDKFVKYL